MALQGRPRRARAPTAPRAGAGPAIVALPPADEVAPWQKDVLGPFGLDRRRNLASDTNLYTRAAFLLLPIAIALFGTPFFVLPHLALCKKTERSLLGAAVRVRGGPRGLPGPRCHGWVSVNRPIGARVQLLRVAVGPFLVEPSTTLCLTRGLRQPDRRRLWTAAGP